MEWLHCHQVTDGPDAMQFEREFLCSQCHPNAMDNSGRTVIKTVDDGRSYHKRRLHCEELRIAQETRQGTPAPAGGCNLG